jgi:hypothetical protein
MAEEQEKDKSRGIRAVAWVALTVVLVLLGIQVGGLVTADSTTLVLLLLALLLAYAAVAPKSVKEVIDRINVLKLPGGIEVQLQATVRAERVIARMPEAADSVKVEPRPRGGGPGAEYDAVRAKLEERVRKSGRYLGLGEEAPTREVVKEIECENLLSEDELHLIRDLLGKIEDEIAKMPSRLREEFLDAGWKFAKRFRTLVFERLLRKEMVRKGWFLIDFSQAQHHRPDFLAFKGDTWLLIAARVVPESTLETRRRLHRTSPPFDATPVVVVPNTKKGIKERDDEFASVRILQLQEVLQAPPLPK